MSDDGVAVHVVELVDCVAQPSATVTTTKHRCFHIGARGASDVPRIDDSEQRTKQELADQFATLHGRAQVLLGICGVLLTASVLITTGRIIGRGGYALARVGGWLLALAGLCDIVTTMIVVGGVLRIRWITQSPDEDLRAWLTRAIAHRDRETRAYHAALAVAILSMLFYQAAVLIVVVQL